ncbi:Teichoic acids export ATP-binding protein TagH [BD1-7 clade bacterium]|uniref:Teichoic acids export ATP-binding protein TagH n=1 Tax=BD1-7 clade bacterium TaxID=2029982 RepID=A0A5S9R0J0_9GAMM|nr:Teichoic acids export ATP-binding protein TagH [BD1-7 clade bacterium]
MNAENRALRPPIVKAQNLRYSYKSGLAFFRPKTIFTALDNISFDIQKGDSVAIIGRNGAGKSTLLRLIAGILKPDAGNIQVNTQKTALLSLQLGFDTNLSGRTNATMNGMLMGLCKQQMDALMPDIIRFSELETFIDQPIHTYSSGMRARLGFAVSLYLKPEMLMIDEVLSVGDAQFRAKCRSAMEKTFASDTTVIMVSHNVKDIEKFCNKVIWIEHGKIVDSGATKGILERYENQEKATEALPSKDHA